MVTRKQLKIAGIALILLYACIFAARLAYDFLTFEDAAAYGNYYYTSFSSDLKASANVASYRKEYAGDGFGGVEVLEQKYEQVASVATKTTAFDSDLARLDSAIEQSLAVVQTEMSRGLTGSRTLSRAIGVKPQYFESCLSAVKSVGALVSLTSQKTDKTYEYRQMLAQKQELEKRLESYYSLRGRSGSINEMLSLEDKIIEVERMLIEQAVDLGEYSDDNALCTINVTLYEGNPASAARIAWNSFTWTNKLYFGILGGAVLAALAAAALAFAYALLRKALASGNMKKPGSAAAGPDAGSGSGSGSGSGADADGE